MIEAGAGVDVPSLPKASTGILSAQILIET